MQLGPLALLALGASLLAVGAYLVWLLPRLPPRVAQAVTAGAALACLGVGLVAGAVGWVVVPVVALLFGHLGWQLGRGFQPRAAVAATAHTVPAQAPAAPPGSVEPASTSAQSTAAAEPTDRSLPATLGRYRIDARIGRGAMGEVYLGRDPQIGRQVAIKTMALSREFSGDQLAEARRRFFREAETAGRLQHPDIVTIFDVGEAQDLAYIAMEYIKGHDLLRHAAPGRLLPLPQLLGVVARVADALAYAHRQGVVHRDIKPANVMVDLDAGVVKVTDFGIARITDATRTRTGMMLGSPSYMSPEQMAGRPADGRSDLYSLGVMLFQLLTGVLPHQGDSMAGLMRQIVNDNVPDIRTLRPELPEALAHVVALALEKRPEMRYRDGHQMAVDLRAVVGWLDSQPLVEPEAGAAGAAQTDDFERTVAFSRLDPRHNSGP